MITITPARTQSHMQDFRELVRDLVSWAMAEFHPDQAVPPNVLANLDRELADLPGKYATPEGALFVAYAADEPAGCIAGFRTVHGDLEVTRLWVRPDFRGLGVGDKLVESLLIRASKSGYTRAVLRSRKEMTSAHKIYRRAGFAEFDGDAYFSNLEDVEVAMRHDLD